MPRRRTIRPTAIYVEDDDEWRELVCQYIKRFGGIEFDDFICGSSLEDVEYELSAAKGPVVLIMDLRLGGEAEPNYTGYQWLLEDLEDFLRRNASTLVFVISGQLHEGIRETLCRKGIPAGHIYDKGSWADERDNFCSSLRKAVKRIDKTAFSNIERGISGRNIDPYLIHRFRACEMMEMDGPETPVLLPFLVQTEDEVWRHKEVPDLHVLAQAGRFWACLGSQRSVVALERDQAVLDVEASRPAIGMGGSEGDAPEASAVLVGHGCSERGDATAVGLIDVSIDIRNMCFCDSDSGRKQTRIVAIWDQSDSTGPPPEGFSFGTVHRQAEIDGYLTTGEVPGRLATLSGGAHATQVASIVCGSDSTRSSGGVAPEARVIWVVTDIEGDSVCRAGLGYSASHLAALEFIKSEARSLGLPVVIQISRSCMAGPHDGTSLLERAIDATTSEGREAGIAVIMPAGDERARGRHAALRLAGDQSLCWRVGDEQRAYALELRFDSSETCAFRLVSPSGETSQLVRWLKKSIRGLFNSGTAYSVTYVRHSRSSGDSRLLVSVDAARGRCVEAGDWRLDIWSQEGSGGIIHAWMEDQHKASPTFTNHLAQGETTLVVPATARHVISVESVETDSLRQGSSLASYGATQDRRRKPEIAVLSATGGMDMTAAAQVAGAIALVFSARAKGTEQQLTAVQIQDAVACLSKNRDLNGEPYLFKLREFLQFLGLGAR